jgi:hypothetical protein
LRAGVDPLVVGEKGAARVENQCGWWAAFVLRKRRDSILVSLSDVFLSWKRNDA